MRRQIPYASIPISGRLTDEPVCGNRQCDVLAADHRCFVRKAQASTVVRSLPRAESSPCPACVGHQTRSRHLCSREQQRGAAFANYYSCACLLAHLDRATSETRLGSCTSRGYRRDRHRVIRLALSQLLEGPPVGLACVVLSERLSDARPPSF